MTVYAYLRLDALDNYTQRKAQAASVTEYAQRIGLGELNPANIRMESCEPLKPLFQRDVADQLAKQLKSGDALIVPHFSTLFSVASDAEAFLRQMNGRGVPVHVVELGRDLTTDLQILTPILRAYAAWESRLIRALQDLERQEEFHSEMLTEYGQMALRHLTEQLAKVNVTAAIQTAVLESYDKTKERFSAKDRAKRSALSILTEEGKRALRKTHPAAYKRLANGAEPGA
jgi:hypothetical protein